MRFSNCQYLEKEGVTVAFRNNNTSAAILDGMPIFYDPFDTATYFGVDAHSAPTALGSSPGLLCGGIAKAFNINDNGSIAANEVAEAFAYGFTDAIVLVGTRASSNSIWASQATFGAGDVLTPETVNGYLIWTRTGVGSLGKQYFLAGQTFAGTSTTVGSASTIGLAGAATVSTIRMKVFVNCM
jgi:hypothetical protein